MDLALLAATLLLARMFSKSGLTAQLSGLLGVLPQSAATNQWGVAGAQALLVTVSAAPVRGPRVGWRSPPDGQIVSARLSPCSLPIPPQSVQPTSLVLHGRP